MGKPTGSETLRVQASSGVTLDIVGEFFVLVVCLFEGLCTAGATTAAAMGESEITDPADSIVALVSIVESGEVGLRQAADLIETELTKMDLVYEMTIHRRQVGLDPCNRDAYGTNSLEVPFS